jgi:hypothetical protein
MPDSTRIPCHRDLPEREAPCGCCACTELRAELAGLLHLRAHLGTDQAPGWAFTDDATHTTDPPPCSTDATDGDSTRTNGPGPATASAPRSPRTPAPNAASPAEAPTAGSTRNAT